MLIVKASNKNPQRSVAKKLEEIKCSQLTNKEQWLLGINKETNQKQNTDVTRIKQI